ncbi:MAG TPA: TlpA disulfide reductase family protein [Usitatibacter sp.]|jgi:thiol-disulfide isomerase/thioredoxin|nr:TlpA disulfide reductase family protein [Usitatibacter sp.]
MVEARPQRFVFAAVALAAALAGTGLWIATAPAPRLAAPDIAPSAVFAAGFTDLQGASRSLGQFQGRVLVVNFWATWCAPCREEMPAFSRLQAAWGQRGVQFVGLSSEEPRQVAGFARGLGVTYPLWVGGDDVSELSRRLGNTSGALPHTVVLDPSGRVMAQKVGAYPEAALNAILESATAQLPLTSLKTS